jgi:hypothetical protein
MTKKKGVAKQIRKKRPRPDVAEWFAKLDRLRGETLFPKGRNQPILRGNINADKKRFSKVTDQLSATSGPTRRKQI